MTWGKHAIETWRSAALLESAMRATGGSDGLEQLKRDDDVVALRVWFSDEEIL
jgi:hypothetical protein